MTRFLALFLVLEAFGLTLPAFVRADSPPAEIHRAIEVDIRGGFVGFDREAYATVRAIMASLVMDGTLEHFVTRVRGMEGGGTFCLELSPLAVPRLASILTQFQALRVDLSSTVFTVRETEHCELPTPRDSHP